MKLTEIHKIKKSSKYYSLLSEMCKNSNALYNQALYQVKHSLKNEDAWLFYSDLDKICRNQPEKYNPYRRLPAQCAQQTLRLLDQNLKAYRNAVKDWSKNKSKYLGMPKFPRFKKSGSLLQLVLTNQQVKLKNNHIHFPKVFDGLILKMRNKNIVKINQVKISPKIDCFKVYVVYEMDDIERIQKSNHIAAIDLGLSNLMAVTFSNNKKPMLFKGDKVLARNHDFNRQLKRYKSILDKTQTGRYSSKRLSRLYSKRNNFMDDYFHKITSKVVDLLLEHNISTVVVGHNVNQKQKSTLKHFVSIPVFSMINKLRYKCEKVGIHFVTIDEAYTSGTSFVDNELPIKQNYQKHRRIKRGLFKTNEGRLINSDVNASYQIMRKFDNQLDIQFSHLMFNPQVMLV